MKIFNSLFAIILFGAVMATFASCRNGQDKIDEPKRASFSVSYDIEDLSSFFSGRNINQMILHEAGDILRFSEVSQRFPVEVSRESGYSMYSVVQGGYFYVFWSGLSTSLESVENANLAVCFSAYIPLDKNTDMFDALQEGVSTAEDVMRIDPDTELVFTMSKGIFSYSYVNSQYVMEIEYERMGDEIQLDNLVVKSISLISRAKSPSSYSLILSEDLP